MFGKLLATAWLLLASLAATASSTRQLYRITLPTAKLRQRIGEVLEQIDEDDALAWKLAPQHAEVLATSAGIERIRSELSLPGARELQRGLLEQSEPADVVAVEKLPVDPDQLLVLQFEQRHECSLRTLGYLDALGSSRGSRSPATYTSSAFFDCWRSADEMDAFLSALASRHPEFLTRLPSVAVSAEQRDIPAYRLSFDASGASKGAVYLQGLAHAREWQAGSSVAFTAAAMLDGLLASDAAVLTAVRSFDWFFVPVLNVDGYRYSFDRPETRFWRKNRRRVTSARSGRVTVGVDLNRNFPVPFNVSSSNGGPSTDTYAGPWALSEPETAGLDRWLRALPLRGALDFHAFGALVLRPPGSSDLVKDGRGDSDALRRIQRLGDAVRDAMPVQYESCAASELYASTGSLMDALFFGRADRTATLTVELAGDSFVVDARSIRVVGAHALSASLAFARELPAFYNTSII